MPAVQLTLNSPEQRRLRAIRACVLAGMFLFSALYTGLTLHGSWDFLFKDPSIIQLKSATRAPMASGEVEAVSGVISLPDDWRKTEITSKAWRYRFVFDLASPPVLDREVYLSYVVDNAQITVNGVPQPYFGQLGERPDFHRSSPLLFPVNASAFRFGENELLVDVYSNEPEMGSLSIVAIGARGAFETHKVIGYVSKRGLAYALLAIDVFAIIAFAFFAVTKSGRFYFVVFTLCVSLLGCMLPHV